MIPLLNKNKMRQAILHQIHADDWKLGVEVALERRRRRRRLERRQVCGAVDDQRLQRLDRAEGQRQVVDASQQRPDFPVGPSSGTIGVELIENVGRVESLRLAHQEVEVGEGELHVVALPQPVPRCLGPVVFELATHR